MIERDFFDTPEKYVSSIGTTAWPPEKASFERKKGVYPYVIESSDGFNNFLTQFADLVFEETTRISARVIITEESLNQKGGKPNKNLIETLIPLNDCSIPYLKDCLLVYVGKNHSSRIPPSEIVHQQLVLAKEIFTNAPQQQRNFNHDQFNIVRFDPNNLTGEIFRQYCHLYSIFGWKADEIEQMLNSPNNIIIYAQEKDNGRIVSSVLGEKGTISITRNNQLINLSLVEITEAATLPGYRGNGIYKMLSNTLLSHLSQFSSPPHLVYGELNLDSPGVLKVAARQGRIPAWKTAEEFGLPHAWFLPQHVIINQSSQTDNQRPESYRYNNLMVAFLPQKVLLETYGKKTNH